MRINASSFSSLIWLWLKTEGVSQVVFLHASRGWNQHFFRKTVQFCSEKYKKDHIQSRWCLNMFKFHHEFTCQDDHIQSCPLKKSQFPISTRPQQISVQMRIKVSSSSPHLSAMQPVTPWRNGKAVVFKGAFCKRCGREMPTTCGCCDCCGSFECCGCLWWLFGGCCG